MKEKRWLGTQKYELHCFYCGGFHMTGNCPQIVKEMNGWKYDRDNNVKYCHLYDEGFKRLGCIGCPMAGKNRLKEFARWPKYEEKYRKAFAAAAAAARNMKEGSQEWKESHPLLASWSDGDAMFDWWMEEKRIKDNPDQTVMFE